MKRHKNTNYIIPPLLLSSPISCVMTEPNAEAYPPLDWFLGFLTTTDVRVVDEALFTAIQSVSGLPWIPHASARDYATMVLRECATKGKLHVKKFAWMLLMLVSPPMQAHVVSTSSLDADEAKRFIHTIRTNVIDFLGGKLESIIVFVSTITALYIRKKTEAEIRRHVDVDCGSDV